MAVQYGYQNNPIGHAQMMVDRLVDVAAKGGPVLTVLTAEDREALKVVLAALSAYPKMWVGGDDACLKAWRRMRVLAEREPHPSIPPPSTTFWLGAEDG